VVGADRLANELPEWIAKRAGGNGKRGFLVDERAFKFLNSERRPLLASCVKSRPRYSSFGKPVCIPQPAIRDGMTCENGEINHFITGETETADVNRKLESGNVREMQAVQVEPGQRRHLDGRNFSAEQRRSAVRDCDRELQSARDRQTERRIVNVVVHRGIERFERALASNDAFRIERISAGFGRGQVADFNGFANERISASVTEQTIEMIVTEKDVVAIRTVDDIVIGKGVERSWFRSRNQERKIRRSS